MSSTLHDRIRDITAHLLTEVSSNVSLEPTLQPLTGESFPSVAPTQKRARIVSKTQNVRDSSQRSASFDVITSSYVASSLDMLNTSDYCNQVHNNKRTLLYNCSSNSLIRAKRSNSGKCSSFVQGQPPFAWNSAMLVCNHRYAHADILVPNSHCKCKHDSFRLDCVIATAIKCMSRSIYVIF